MSHVGNGENDFQGMEGFSDKQREYATKVRETARDILEMLEPKHINTYGELLRRLKMAMEKAELDFRTNNPNREPTSEIENERFISKFTDLCLMGNSTAQNIPKKKITFFG